MPNFRVLVVDDAVVMRRLLTEVIQSDPGMEVVGTAPDGRIALQKLTQLNPDLVTLDIEMPVMDGLATLRAIRATHPHLPVIMFSATTRQGASATLDALAAGANDYVTKPTEVRDLSGCIAKLQKELIPCIRHLCEARGIHRTNLAMPIPAIAAPPVLRAPSVSLRPNRAHPFDLVCISSSTGGPNALVEVFKKFTRPLPVPLAIVQHMPPMFTTLLAERIDHLKSPMRCAEVHGGEVLQPGHAYLAPGGRHFALQRNLDGHFVAQVNDDPPENSCRPAADVMLRTAAATHARILSVVLTGMGSDGLRGCEYVHEAGGAIVIQDRESSVIWGMPGSVAQSSLPHTVCSLGKIAAEIERHLSRSPHLVA